MDGTEGQVTPTEGTQTETTNNESSGSSDGGFDLGSWDGNRDSLPGEHHAIYDKIHGSREAKQEANAGRKLQAHLQKQFDATVRAQQTVSQTRTNEDGVEEPLTREQALKLFEQQETQRSQRSRVDGFRKSMLDVVGTPQQYGDATVIFSSEREVDDFRDFVSKTLNGELTARDLLALYKAEDIRRQHSDLAVKNFEKNLNRKPSNAGGAVETRTTAIPVDTTKGNRRRDRAPRTAELLQENNPELYNEIVNGKAQLF